MCVNLGQEPSAKALNQKLLHFSRTLKSNRLSICKQTTNPAHIPKLIPNDAPVAHLQGKRKSKTICFLITPMCFRQTHPLPHPHMWDTRNFSPLPRTAPIRLSFPRLFPSLVFPPRTLFIKWWKILPHPFRMLMYSLPKYRVRVRVMVIEFGPGRNFNRIKPQSKYTTSSSSPGNVAKGRLRHLGVKFV